MIGKNKKDLGGLSILGKRAVREPGGGDGGGGLPCGRGWRAHWP